MLQKLNHYYEVYSPTWIDRRVYVHRNDADKAVEEESVKFHRNQGKGKLKIERVPKNDTITWIYVYDDTEIEYGGISCSLVSTLTLITCFMIVRRSIRL